MEGRSPSLSVQDQSFSTCIPGHQSPSHLRIFIFIISWIYLCHLTACYLHGAGLGVQGVELEVHGAGQGEGHPDTEQDGSVSKNSDIEVGNENIVHAAASLITEESIWHPHLPWLGYGQVLDLVFSKIINYVGWI